MLFYVLNVGFKSRIAKSEQWELPVSVEVSISSFFRLGLSNQVCLLATIVFTSLGSQSPLNFQCFSKDKLESILVLCVCVSGFVCVCVCPYFVCCACVAPKRRRTRRRESAPPAIVSGTKEGEKGHVPGNQVDVRLLYARSGPCFCVAVFLQLNMKCLRKMKDPFSFRKISGDKAASPKRKEEEGPLLTFTSRYCNCL